MPARVHMDVRAQRFGQGFARFGGPLLVERVCRVVEHRRFQEGGLCLLLVGVEAEKCMTWNEDDGRLDADFAEDRCEQCCAVNAVRLLGAECLAEWPNGLREEIFSNVRCGRDA